MNNIIEFPTIQLAEEEPIKEEDDREGQETSYISPDLNDMCNFNFRKEWENSLPFIRETGMPVSQIIQHTVTFTDLTRAINISTLLKKDYEASQYFMNTLAHVMNNKNYRLLLSEVPEEYRGYVWSLNFYNVLKANAFAEQQLSSIIRKPVIRHIFF